MKNQIALQEILKAINLKLGPRGLTCPLCEGKTWEPPALTALIQCVFAESEANFAQTNRIFPLAILCCSGCGYSISLNLIQLGLWNKWHTRSSLVIPSGVTLPSNGALRPG